MKNKLLIIVLLISWTIPKYSKAQCEITSKSNGHDLSGYWGQNIIVYRDTSNLVSLSFRTVINKKEEYYSFHLNIMTMAFHQKKGITPNYVKLKFSNGSALEFYSYDIKTDVDNGVQTYEATIPMNEEKFGNFRTTILSKVSISGAETQINAIDEPFGITLKMAANCMFEAIRDKIKSYRNLQ
jgi:hypothetical protein